VGRTTEETDWFGDKYQQHWGQDGKKHGGPTEPIRDQIGARSGVVSERPTQTLINDGGQSSRVGQQSHSGNGFLVIILVVGVLGFFLFNNTSHIAPSSEVNNNLDVETQKQASLHEQAQLIRQQEEEILRQQAIQDMQERMSEAMTPTQEIGRIVFTPAFSRQDNSLLVTDVDIVFESGAYKGERIGFNRIKIIDLEVWDREGWGSTSYNIVIEGISINGTSRIRRDVFCGNEKETCEYQHNLLMSAWQNWHHKYGDLY
jgi:hypothetical protein